YVIIDISPIISEELAVFPGDTAFSRNVLLSFEHGHHLGLSSIKSTVHLGAHTDAPNHYDAKGCDIADRKLSFYIGECQVVSVQVACGQCIQIKDLPCEVKSSRVL